MRGAGETEERENGKTANGKHGICRTRGGENKTDNNEEHNRIEAKGR